MTQPTFFSLKRLALPLCTVAACLVAPLAQAGTITGVGAVTGTGLGFVAVPVIITPDEGSPDDTGNIGIPIKRFDQTGYIDIEFFVRGSDPSGTTEYLLFESVDNNTGIDWSSYTMELGQGLGAGFAVSDGSNGLTFDAPNYIPTPSSSVFPSVTTNPTVLHFYDGIQSTGSQTYQVWIDVPDGIQTFTLRQYPTPVPEPGTLVLAAIAVGGLGLLKLRRRRA
jgi:hypothetical protein